MDLKLKKDYLTKEEIDAIIVAAMGSFREESLIEGLNFNYLAMEHSFIDSLGLICIEDFDDEIRDKIYNEGIRDEFIDSIKNARYTYNLLNKIADKSIQNLELEGVMNQYIGEIPENSVDLNDLEKILPQFQEVVEKYNKIISGTKEETK